MLQTSSQDSTDWLERRDEFRACACNQLIHWLRVRLGRSVPLDVTWITVVGTVMILSVTFDGKWYIGKAIYTIPETVREIDYEALESSLHSARGEGVQSRRGTTRIVRVLCTVLGDRTISSERAKHRHTGRCRPCPLCQLHSGRSQSPARSRGTKQRRRAKQRYYWSRILGFSMVFRSSFRSGELNKLGPHGTIS